MRNMHINHIRIPQHPIKTYQNIDKVTDIIPDSHLASRGPFKGTGMLLRAQLGSRTSQENQETPSHQRQGADRRWNEVLIMLQSDIKNILL